MDDLDYETHLNHYTRIFCAGQAHGMLAFAQRQAQAQHSLVVSDALRDCHERLILRVPPTLKNDEAIRYLIYGAGRRLDMMLHSYREIVYIAYPDRTDPLSHDEQQSLGRDINLLYMNLRGLLDNLAATLLFEKQPTLNLNRTAVDLFSSRFRESFEGFPAIAAELTLHDSWNKDVKNRRDPVAHRIPLYLPHTVATPEEAAEYSKLNDEFAKHANAMNFEESSHALKRMHHIGTYRPYFMHHPSEPAIPIYPTIPDDLTHVIRIARIVERALLSTSLTSTATDTPRGV